MIELVTAIKVGICGRRLIRSRYAGQLEETLLQRNQLKNQILEDPLYHMDDLKKRKFRLERLGCGFTMKDAKN